MAYINQPIDLRLAFDAIKDRLRKLETAVRFTAPDVSTEPTYPRVGDIIYNNTEDYMEYWNGTEWVIFGDNNVGSPLLPYTPTWTGTGLAYTGTPATGYYQKIGKVIYFSIYISTTNVTNFGSGAYSVTLPFTPANHAVCNGGLHHNTSHYNLILDVEPSTATAELYYPTSNGVNDPMDHNSPHTLVAGDYFYFSGHYFIA